MYLIISIGNGPCKTIPDDCRVIYVSESKAWATRKLKEFKKEGPTGRGGKPLDKFYLVEIN
jgi:hypothetical protein